VCGVLGGGGGGGGTAKKWEGLSVGKMSSSLGNAK